MTALSRSCGTALAAAVLLSAGCSALARQGQAPAASVSAADQMRADITLLAGDQFEGRGTGTPGNDSAAAFIARRYRALKLMSIAQADRAACATGSRQGTADCYVLPFTTTVSARISITSAATPPAPVTQKRGASSGMAPTTTRREPSW